MQVQLNPAEWAVLGVVAEGPTHGFALARQLAPDGAVGRVWTVPRPVVYQVLNKLDRMALVSDARTEPGTRGPVRTLFGLTPLGRRALESWLHEPVEHVRDVRSLLLLKLALLDRAGRDPAPLIDAQRTKVKEQIRSLRRSRRGCDGFERVLVEWRLAGSRATVEFLDAISTLSLVRH